MWKNGGKSGFGGESRDPRRGVPRPVCARGHGRPRGSCAPRRLVRAPRPMWGVSVVLASVLILAATLVGGVAALSASLSF